MKIAVAVSGTGTLLKAMIAQGLPIDLVLADRACRALNIANKKGIKTELVERTRWGAKFNRKAYTEDFEATLAKHDIDLVAMAGFMTVLHGYIFNGRYEHRILNTHPSLLPKYPGAHAVRNALAAGETVTGFTIHIATATVDDARHILAQVPVHVRLGENESQVHERIKEAERLLYPVIINQYLKSLRS